MLVQRHVYFVSEVLHETKVRYPQVQKLMYAVVLTQRICATILSLIL